MSIETDRVALLSSEIPLCLRLMTLMTKPLLRSIVIAAIHQRSDVIELCRFTHDAARLAQHAQRMLGKVLRTHALEPAASNSISHVG